MDEFKTIEKNIEVQITEKKSKFIAYMCIVQNKTQAEEIIKEVITKHFSAKHNCYAYIIEEKGSLIKKYSDDKEPARNSGGTNTEYIRNTRIN